VELRRLAVEEQRLLHQQEAGVGRIHAASSRSSNSINSCSIANHIEQVPLPDNHTGDLAISKQFEDIFEEGQVVRIKNGHGWDLGVIVSVVHEQGNGRLYDVVLNDAKGTSMSDLSGDYVRGLTMDEVQGENQVA
jgi:hypothetical protein